MNNEIQLGTSDPIQFGTVGPNPYPPSYLDRFMDAVEALPAPYWLTYLVLFLLESAVMHVLAWLDGWLPAYTFNLLLLTFPLWQWGPFAIITYLDSVSRGAISTFAPLLDLQDESITRLKDEFSTMPARPVIVSGVVWSIVYCLTTYLVIGRLYDQYRFGNAFAVIIVLEGLVTYATGSVIYYHSLRQLRLVSRTVSLVSHFNLFRLDPVYAFSAVTSQTGIAWVILLSLSLLTFPIQLAVAPSLATWAAQIVLAVAAFALPLRVVHQRLVAEKRRLLAELNQRTEATLERLHRCLDENELDDAAHLSSALAGLSTERDILGRVSTWPWRAGMLPRFLTIVVLPIILFLVQLTLGHLWR
jgi:hypothetical protein